MKPLIKWIGGKGKLLPQLLPLLPPLESIHTYVEPFLGSGALFFALEFDDDDAVVLGDSNPALINVYRSVRDSISTVTIRLEALAEGHYAAEKRGDEVVRSYYNKIRDAFNSDDSGDIPAAARFLYLNRTCFNGVWRVNRDGEFNVPLGDYKHPAIYDEALLLAANKRLRQRCVQLVLGDFSDVIFYARELRDAFVYLDPPYVPVSETADFTSYTVEKFGQADLERLRALCDELDSAGARFMLSNSAAPTVRELFGKYDIQEISRRGSINSDKNKRGDVTELVVRNYR